MSKLDEIQSLIERGVNQFIAICTNANRDLPFHDYKRLTNLTTWQSYVVGNDNINATGDQKKLFVSKSTLLFCTADCSVKFNNANNVVIQLLANTYYEFKSNIHTLFHMSASGDEYLKAWFEGVMYHEARRPE